MNGEPRTARDLLAEACRWRLLSLLVSRPCDETRTAVEALASEARESDLKDLSGKWREGATEGAYLALLGPGGVVPARVGAYRGFADPGWMLAELAQIHTAFGFTPRAEEPPDHIASLAELVSYLWLKEAYARELGDEDALELTRMARDRVQRDYLSPMAEPLAQRLEACGAVEWSAVAAHMARLLPAPPPMVPGLSESPKDFACGACVASDRSLEETPGIA